MQTPYRVSQRTLLLKGKTNQECWRSPRSDSQNTSLLSPLGTQVVTSQEWDRCYRLPSPLPLFQVGKQQP